MCDITLFGREKITDFAPQIATARLHCDRALQFCLGRSTQSLAIAVSVCALAYFDARAQQVVPREQQQISPERDKVRDTSPISEPVPSRPDLVDDGVRFVLKDIRFRGDSVFSNQELRTGVAEFIGRTVGFADLQALTRQLEDLYQQAGFIAVRAIVPAQELDDGVLDVQIVEGRIAEVVLRGDLGRSGPALKDILSGLEGLKPLERTALERRLLLARDISGVNLISALRAKPDGTLGAVSLIVDATFAPFDGFVSLNNFGSESVGPYLGTLGVGANSLVLSGDRLSLVGLTSAETGEQVLGQFTYSAPLAIAGLEAGFSFSEVLSEPGDILAPLDVDYRSFTGRANLDYALVRNRERSVFIGAYFEAVHQEQNAPFDSLIINEDLRILGAKARWIEQDLFGGFFDATSSLRIGLPTLGASTESDIGVTGDPQFVVFGATARYDQQLVDDFTMRARIAAQTSFRDLPSFEVFSLGNFTIGRGFNPGSATGDHGVAGSIEAAYHPRIADLPFLDRSEIYGFFDAGQVFADGNDANLFSAGAGIRLNVRDTLDVDGFVAVPIGSTDRFLDDGTQVLFRATAYF